MRGVALAALSAATLGAVPATASASESLSLQAQAMRGGFVLAPAGGQRSAACIVDTGLDTSAVDVRGDVIRAAIDGVPGTGPAAGPNGPVMHGTWMTQYATAPIDGKGMVGPTPEVPLILVRAMSDGTENFATSQYVAGMRRCGEVAHASGLRLASVGLALGTDGTSGAELADISSAVYDLGVPVFAAAGNRPGVPQFPAAATGVVAIAAASAVDGSRCATSADADAEAAGIVGIGCLVTMPIAGKATTVVSAGTSGASVSVAAAVAQVCDWAGASLTPAGCWERVQSTARSVPAGRVPDLTAAAVSLGRTVPAVSLPAATFTPSTPATAPGASTASSVITIGPDSGSGTEIVVTTPPSWYRLGSKPRVRRLSRGRVKVISPDSFGRARLWTNLRGARVGARTSTIGRPRAGAKTVRVSAREATADGTMYERRWTLRLPPAGL